MSGFSRHKARLKTIAIRTGRTMAQTAGGVLATSGVLHGVDWGFVVSTTVLAGIVCILMNLGNE